MSIQSTKVDDYEKSTVSYFNLIKKNMPLSKKEEKNCGKDFEKKMICQLEK